jgi:diguanylate cyclase (GGDEF)-like protein
MKQKQEHKHRIYDICYFVMFSVFLFFVCWTTIRYQGPSLSEASFDEAISCSEGWTLSDGTSVNTNKLNKTDGAEPYQEVSIFHDIPEDLQEGDALCFRSKNIFFTVYIDGAAIYTPYADQSPIYTNSYGTNWHYITLPKDTAGTQIEIRYYRVYDNARACMDNLYFGQPAGVILQTWQDRLVSFITCILLLFVGLLLIVIDFPVNMGVAKNHELRYLGLFALSISIWCLSETNLIQFFMGNSRAMQLVSCCSLMLIPIPTVLYLDSAFGLTHKFLLPLVSGLSVLEFTVCWALHFLNIADIHETMTLSHIMLAVAAVILLVVIFRNTFLNRESSLDIFQILRGVGLCSISVATIVDIVRYYIGNGSDSAMFVRIGLLVFILCFGSSSMERTISAVRLGTESVLISQLAYKDGLTKLGNRTAFNEQLALLEEKKEEFTAIGIVMFDVNNLKYVNDNLGHHAGDEMIVKSAEAIHQSFGGLPGDCYRIGGDEFAVILCGEAVEQLYRIGLKYFEKFLSDYNARPDIAFHLQIAHGFSFYHPKQDSKTTMTDIYERADSLMYENKKAIKAQNPRPS